ncbi:Uncharacterised protein [Mycobacteroides abscessus subsp. abscessus]|nr:Uncharacterised protein [Mycobacteroides abscessus subsp. abscessus]
MVDVTGGAVHHTTGGDPDPQRAAPVPAAQVTLRAAGQRCQRGVLVAARRGRLDHVEGAAEEVGRDDRGGPGADVQAQGEERFVVDLDRDTRPADGAGDGEVGPLTQHPGVQQGGDLPVHRGDAEPGGLRDHVPGDGAAQPRRTEDRAGGGVGDPQRRRDDVVPSQEGALGVCGRADAGGGRNGGNGSRHLGVLGKKSGWWVLRPHLPTARTKRSVS